MSDIRKHKTTQKAFAAHIRNPDKYPKPEGIDEQRMDVYRQLFFNNINGLIKQVYPVLYSLYDTVEWSKMIRHFYQKQNNQTPYFTEIATEFLQFLKHQPADKARPFRDELAHYEWLEMDIEQDSEKPQYQAVDGQQIRHQKPIITPLIRIHSYHYPVHQIGFDFQPTEPQGPYHLMVWRNHNHQIHFATINKISKELLTQLQTMPGSGEEAILKVFKNNNMEVTEQTMAFGYQQLFKWHQQDIIIRTQKEDTL